MKRILVTLLFPGFLTLNAQQILPCATDEVYVNMLKSHPELQAFEEKANEDARLALPFFQLGKAAAIKYIPVVFHVIHNYGKENISQAQLNDCIRVLNEDFRKMAGTNGGSSTDSRAADVQIEFRLAQLDPDGKPTDGVNRIFNASLTENATDASKALSYWDSNRYFNIWVVNTINSSSPPATTLGYAQFPWLRSSKPTTDGIIVRADQVGNIGFARTDQAGRTVTHEAGHWCGLFHTFQGGCVGGTSTTCASQGDQICDTPPVSVSSNGCPASQNSCTNDSPDLPDMFKNYMDYVDGTCMNIFSAGQGTRMNSMVNGYRSYAFSVANLNGIGINDDGSYRTLNASVIKAPYTYPFNSGSLTGGWEIENLNNATNGWRLNTTVGLNGNGCMQIKTFNNSTLNTFDGFFSPNIDLTTLSSPYLIFDEAYAKKLAGSSDRLHIYISNNYGRTETLIQTILASDLETSGVNATEFTPSGASEWKQLKVDLTPYKSYTNARIRFELQALRGNDLYIDNFSIVNFVNVQEILKKEMNFSVAPNPVSGNATIRFQTQRNEKVSISLCDISGRIVSELSDMDYTAGKHEVYFNTSNMQNGMYLLLVTTNEGRFSEKIIVN